ncbi:Zinc finger, BED-type [Artemisia annua]|uniref:Zinc finger, BED-type n=1 Tax=Artemisia annua TaxID=35608 RepID=A0A2U1PBH3_ARTAN|nr:Zinc finger, BED-type [Artemisia annua]
MDSVDSNLDGEIPTTTEEGNPSTNSLLKRNSGDPGWNYGTLCDAKDRCAIKCTLCGFISKGGITRLKYHVAGIQRKGVAICRKASEEDKAVCAALLEKPKEKKKDKRIREEEVRAEVEIADEDNAFNVGSKRQKPKNLGPMDKFANPIDPESVTINPRQQNLIDALDKERTYNQSIQDDVMVSNAVFACLEKFFHGDFEKQDQVMNKELPKYKGKEGDFGRMLAAKGCLENNSSYDPDVLRSPDASKAQSWIVAISDEDEEKEEDGSVGVSGDAVGGRELHNDDFVSDEEQVEGHGYCVVGVGLVND